MAGQFGEKLLWVLVGWPLFLLGGWAGVDCGGGVSRGEEGKECKREEGEKMGECLL